MSQRSKKVIYNVRLQSERHATNAKTLVRGVEGVTDVKTDTRNQRLTAIGTFDPVDVVKKLRKKFSSVKLVSVALAEKSGKTKEEPEKQESKKAGTSKEEGPEKGDVVKLVNVYAAYNPYLDEPYKVEVTENPNTCVIC